MKVYRLKMKLLRNVSVPYVQRWRGLGAGIEQNLPPACFDGGHGRPTPMTQHAPGNGWRWPGSDTIGDTAVDIQSMP